MLLLWCLLLTLPTFEGVKGTGDIAISDEVILKTFLEAQEKILNDGEKKRELNRASGSNNDFHHPQIKADLKAGQQLALILELTTRKLADQMNLKTKQQLQQLGDMGGKIVQQLKQAPKINDGSQCDSEGRYRSLDGTCNNIKTQFSARPTLPSFACRELGRSMMTTYPSLDRDRTEVSCRMPATLALHYSQTRTSLLRL
ncbi:hypothetical protein OS493_009492 [Desmophyllum pertusum]|uniref:Uncharacterized protein n=1 Tax=Desmophyllum pertusum TaxID=174260 RepID=A0A9W9Z315_9CNID|nr:hypothetical protein OS493_009492 [Desmophyllum pertusum]